MGNSAQFVAASSQTLSRTPGSATDRQKWTWSGWIKRASTGSEQHVFGGGSNGTTLGFDSGDKFISYYYSSGYIWELRTTATYTSTSAWVHFLVAVDTTQATASNRVKVWVNGTQISSFSTATYPAQNTSADVNNNVLHLVGNLNTQSLYYNGKLAEMYLIDGQQLTPTSFITATPGIAKSYTGTFGTNGVYQNYSNSGSLGADSSGNANTFTNNNAVTQSSDHPGMAVTLTAAAGSFTLSGVAAGLKLGFGIVAATGVYVLTGVAAGLKKALTLTAAAGSYALTGVAATLRKGYTLVAVAGSYVLTGVAAIVSKGIRLTAAAGSYTLTGVAAGLKKALHLIAATGVYALTGRAAGLIKGLHLIAAAGSYVLTGNTIVMARAVAAARKFKHRVSNFVLQKLRVTQPTLED